MKLEQEKQINFNDKSVKSILELYDFELDYYSAATSGIENTTLIVTTKTRKIVVRIYRLGKKRTEEIDIEIDFMRYLYKNEVKVPLVIANNKGNLITYFEYEGKTWQVVVMNFVVGEHAQNYSHSLLKEMAKTQATIHLLGGEYDTNAEITDTLTSLKENYFIPLIDIASLSSSELSHFLQRAKSFSVQLYNKLPKGLCHLDYDKDNIITRNERIDAVLDFDDLAIAPFVVCLGYTLWHIWRYANMDAMVEYLKEYETTRPLNSLERQYLTKIILFRHYVISDLKILNNHTTKQDIADYIDLESEIIRTKAFSL